MVCTDGRRCRISLTCSLLKYVLSSPNRQLENTSSLHLQFYQCQFWKAVKLFSSILLWHGILPGGDPSVMGLAVDGLLNRYLLLALQNLPPSVKTVDKVAAVSAGSGCGMDVRFW